MVWVLWPQTGRLVFVAESWLNPACCFFGPFGEARLVLEPSRKLGGGGRSGREVQGWGTFASGRGLVVGPDGDLGVFFRGRRSVATPNLNRNGRFSECRSALALCTRWVPGCMWSRPQAESVVMSILATIMYRCLCGKVLSKKGGWPKLPLVDW